MFVSSQEIRLDARPSSSSSSSAAGNNSPSTLQEQFLESQKLQLNDCAKEWTSSYDTIELLKQSLKQLSTLTQQQAAAEQVVLNHSEGVPSNTPSPAFYNTIENFDIQPLYVASRSKTLSRRGSFSSQYSTGSSKSVRFGNVSIVQDLVAAQIVTTVDDFELRERKQQQQTTKQQPDNRLDEYVQMVQSTRQRKRTTEGESTTTTKPKLTRANSSSALDDKKARKFSLFRKKQDNLNAAVLQASLQASSHPDSSASVASRTASRSSQRSQRSSSRSISKLFAKTFGRRKGPQANSNNNDNSNHVVDISEVTMDDTVTETSSNDDSGAIVKTDARYKPQPQRRNTRKQNSSVPEQSPSRRRGVSRQNSGASAASASSGIVRIAARLLSRRSSNNSDISSMASSIGSEVGHVEYVPPQQIVVSSERNEDTRSRSSSPSSLPDDDDEVVNEDAVQLQNEIANLKKQLMGLVMEHMEESELRKEQQGMKYKQVVVAKS